mmetsp:Transcript_1427/g.6225  ORF Transcript_1427/g.6225 Transcript_1427/m.6225 type:complete len:350 (-) Transcript_1427:1164-2213(-)
MLRLLCGRREGLECGLAFRMGPNEAGVQPGESPQVSSPQELEDVVSSRCPRKLGKHLGREGAIHHDGRSHILRRHPAFARAPEVQLRQNRNLQGWLTCAAIHDVRRIPLERYACPKASAVLREAQANGFQHADEDLVFKLGKAPGKEPRGLEEAQQGLRDPVRVLEDDESGCQADAILRVVLVRRIVLHGDNVGVNVLIQIWLHVPEPDGPRVHPHYVHHPDAQQSRGQLEHVHCVAAAVLLRDQEALEVVGSQALLHLLTKTDHRVVGELQAELRDEHPVQEEVKVVNLTRKEDQVPAWADARKQILHAWRLGPCSSHRQGRIRRGLHYSFLALRHGLGRIRRVPRLL